MNTTLIDLFTDQGIDTATAKDVYKNTEFLLPEIGVQGVLNTFSHEFQTPAIKKALVEMVADNNPLTLLIDETEGALSSCLFFANMLGTSTLNRCLYHLSKSTGEGVICVLYADVAPHSLYFCRYREHPDGEHIFNGKKYGFSGNGGIIYHSYCQEWSTHT